MEKYDIPEPNSLDSMEGIDYDKKGPDEEIANGNKSEKQTIAPELKDLIQEPAADYEDIISLASRVDYDESKSTGGAWWQANHGRMLDNLVYEPNRIDKEVMQLFKKSISGNTLCDLGSAGGRLDYLANTLSAGIYISVDNFAGGQSIKELIDQTVDKPRTREFREPTFDGTIGNLEGVLPILDVRADMLDFVSRLKDSSVNIMINGIDGDVIPPKEYHELLAKELLRVLKVDGLIFGNNSDCLNILNRMISNDTELQKHFEIIDPKKHRLGVGGVVVIHKKINESITGEEEKESDLNPRPEFIKRISEIKTFYDNFYGKLKEEEKPDLELYQTRNTLTRLVSELKSRNGQENAFIFDLIESFEVYGRELGFHLSGDSYLHSIYGPLAQMLCYENMSKKDVEKLIEDRSDFAFIYGILKGGGAEKLEIDKMNNDEIIHFGDFYLKKEWEKSSAGMTFEGWKTHNANMIWNPLFQHLKFDELSDDEIIAFGEKHNDGELWRYIFEKRQNEWMLYDQKTRNGIADRIANCYAKAIDRKPEEVMNFGGPIYKPISWLKNQS